MNSFVAICVGACHWGAIDSINSDCISLVHSLYYERNNVLESSLTI